jgi:O-antigen chain-terminating methyltransferase
VFRGSGEDNEERLARYIDILREAGAGHLGKKVLDIGCGRGEWLKSLKDNNIPAYGVDINSVMVERTAALGLDVRNADAIEHLKGLPDSAVSALTAFHFIEHLPLEVLIDFLDEALRVLAPGGIAIFETPNPETVQPSAITVYFDPTHRNPIPPQTLQFIVAHRGFQNAEILRLNPFTDRLLRQPNENAERPDLLLLRPQDYAVIARRL